MRNCRYPLKNTAKFSTFLYRKWKCWWGSNKATLHSSDLCVGEINQNQACTSCEGGINTRFVLHRKRRKMTDLCEPIMGIKGKGNNYLNKRTLLAHKQVSWNNSWIREAFRRSLNTASGTVSQPGEMGETVTYIQLEHD